MGAVDQRPPGVSANKARAHHRLSKQRQSGADSIRVRYSLQTTLHTFGDARAARRKRERAHVIGPDHHPGARRWVVGQLPAFATLRRVNSIKA
jgi:hypothetical protein